MPPPIGTSVPLPSKPFDATAWKARIIEAVEESIRRSAKFALESAITDAPVRQVFKGGRGGQRKRQLPSGIKTVGRAFPGSPEIIRPGAPLVLAAVRRFHPNVFAPFPREPRPRTFGQYQAEERAGLRGGREVEGGQLMNPSAQEALNAQGKYELQTGRALFKPKTGPTTLGGRLRGSIRMLGPHHVGSRIEARIVSPVYYSKFQEFGTRHNKATPYMRPAIAKLTMTYRRDLIRAINRAGAAYRSR